ncbi:MAG: hypothetical protein JWM98_843 [Thermoleophilia bacterium]|nr:hypothetical protein [Thermoleophilia bacterium]
MNAALLLLAGVALAAAAWRWSMHSVADASRVALVTVLGVTASAFNVIVPIASVEATTTVVLCAALALGARTGVAVALVAIIGSSVAGGLGPWTVWQVVAYVLVALVGGALGPATRRTDWFAPRGALVLGVTAPACTLAYDVIVTVPSAITLHTSPTAALLLGAAFTITHVVFTTAFTIVGGPPLLHALTRARPRLDGGTVVPVGRAPQA